MGRLSPGTCRSAARGSGPASLIAPVRLAQAGLNRPARLATVPCAVAAGAIEHGLSGVSGSTVIGGRRRTIKRRGAGVWGGAVVRGGAVWGGAIWGGAIWGGAIV